MQSRSEKEKAAVGLAKMVDNIYYGDAAFRAMDIVAERERWIALVAALRKEVAVKDRQRSQFERDAKKADKSGYARAKKEYEDRIARYLAEKKRDSGVFL